MRANELVDGFDEARKRLRPTNGECIAVFATLLAGSIAEADKDLRGDLLRAVLPAVMASALRTKNEPKALRDLFDLCGVEHA